MSLCKTTGDRDAVRHLRATGFSSRQTWLPISARLRKSCVTWGKSFNLSEPVLSSVEWDINHTDLPMMGDPSASRPWHTVGSGQCSVLIHKAEGPGITRAQIFPAALSGITKDTEAPQAGTLAHGYSASTGQSTTGPGGLRPGTLPESTARPRTPPCAR